MDDRTLTKTALQPLWDAQKALAPLRGWPAPTPGAPPTRVAIVGGGPSGLVAAWALHQTEGFEFVVFEKAAQVGGSAFTFAYDAHKHGGGAPGQARTRAIECRCDPCHLIS